MSRVLLAIFCLVILNSAVVKSANILFLSNVPSPSHGIWNFRLIGGLAAKGHNITVLSPNTPKAPIKNVHLISMADIYTEMMADGSIVAAFVDNDSLKVVDIYAGLMMKLCQIATTLSGFKTLLNYPDNFKFDLVIYDFTCGSCLLGFLHKFNYPPLVAVSAFKFGPDLVELMGGHNFPAYIPRTLGSYTIDMNLYQRVNNLIGVLYEIYHRRTVTVPGQNKIITPYFEGVPSIAELEQRATIALINTNPATDFPVPLPPNIIEVGGLQIVDPNPLPGDLEKFINGSSLGTVLISFGTNVRSEDFSEPQQNIVVELAKRFPKYNFLWKFDADVTKGKVSNLMVRPWLPQNDLLAHPKLKAFVTHCGGLSTHEATYHGIPMIAVPFFGDQFTNARESVQAGVAVKVDIGTFSIETLEAAVRTILEDPSYDQRIKLRSSRFRSRPMKPLDTAVWWIEYILRDPNPSHIKSPVLGLGHFKANCLDIVLYFEILMVVFYLEVKFLLPKLWKIFFSQKSGNKLKSS